MEEILPDIRLILGVLGHPVLEPLEASSQRSEVLTLSPAESSLIGREFVFSGPSFEARGQVTDEGFLIKKGSTAAVEFRIGNPGYDTIRKKLMVEGTLVPENGRLVFTKDFSASSSTQAASIVAGGNRSGPGMWKSGDKALGELESASVAEPDKATPEAST
jgi:hypothetical protein